MVCQTLHYFGVCFLDTAKVASESVLIQFFTRFAVPESAGIGTYLIRQHNGSVGESSKFKLKVNEGYSASLPEILEKLVYRKRIFFYGLDLLACCKAECQCMVIIEQRITALIIFV